MEKKKNTIYCTTEIQLKNRETGGEENEKSNSDN